MTSVVVLIALQPGTPRQTLQLAVGILHARAQSRKTLNPISHACEGRGYNFGSQESSALVDVIGTIRVDGRSGPDLEHLPTERGRLGTAIHVSGTRRQCLYVAL